jgi:hypothetical protein
MKIPFAQARTLLGPESTEWLTTAEIAREFKFASAEAARKWVKRHRVPYVLRGRALLVTRRDMDQMCRPGRGVRGVL